MIQNNVCWFIIIKYFIGLLTGLVSAPNHTKCVIEQLEMYMFQIKQTIQI